MSEGFVRIISKNVFTVRSLTLIFEDAGYTVTDSADEAELTVTDTPSALGDEKHGVFVYLADRGSALPKGAAAVIAKPFSWKELLDTVEALLRRRTDGIVLRGDTLVYKGKSVKLTEREAKLFEFFKLHEGTPVTREEMLASVWETGQGGTNVTDVYVNYLRKKLKAAFGADFITSVRGVGYVYEFRGE